MEMLSVTSSSDPPSSPSNLSVSLLNYLIIPYENLQPDTARIQPDSGQKAFFAARMERDIARHEICLALQRERDICLATV